MPQVSEQVWVPVPPATAFAVSQTTGELRLSWDPFIRRQFFLGGATAPGKGVRTRTFARLGPAMTSEYVSYHRPTNVGMTMVEGPWFFDQFGGGWRFRAEERDGIEGTLATWKYTFSVRPRWLRFVGHPVGSWLLGREIRRRIAAFAQACERDDVLAAVGRPG